MVEFLTSHKRCPSMDHLEISLALVVPADLVAPLIGNHDILCSAVLRPCQLPATTLSF